MTNKTYQSALSEMATVRREAEDDLRDVVLMADVAENALKVVISGCSHSYPSAAFSDVTRALKLLKQNAQIAADYQGGEAFSIEKDIKAQSQNTGSPA